MYFLVFLVTYYVIPRKVADRPIPRKKRPIDPLWPNSGITYHVTIRAKNRDYNDRRVTRISKDKGLFESTYNTKHLMKF